MFTTPKKIAVIGPRTWKNLAAVQDGLIRAVAILYPVREAQSEYFDWSAITLLHGGVGGADRLAIEYATTLGMSIEQIVVDRDKYTPAKAAVIRTVRMLRSGADLLLTVGHSPIGDKAIGLAQAQRLPIVTCGNRTERGAA